MVLLATMRRHRGHPYAILGKVGYETWKVGDLGHCAEETCQQQSCLRQQPALPRPVPNDSISTAAIAVGGQPPSMILIQWPGERADKASASRQGLTGATRLNPIRQSLAGGLKLKT